MQGSDEIAVSVVIPTYNEAANIRELCDELATSLAGSWSYEIIIVDDSSPDGTGAVVKELIAERRPVVLIERPRRGGLGSAVIEGLRRARGERWVMMDGDLSHRPEDVTALVAALDEADIAVGSRYVRGGGIRRWPLYRRITSRAASSVGRRIVGLPLSDLTSGFAAYRRSVVEPVLGQVQGHGFKLLIEIMANVPGASVKEVPVSFTNRVRGRSKASFGEVPDFLRLCWRLRTARSRLRRGGVPASDERQGGMAL